MMFEEVNFFSRPHLYSGRWISIHRTFLKIPFEFGGINVFFKYFMLIPLNQSIFQRLKRQRQRPKYKWENFFYNGFWDKFGLTFLSLSIIDDETGLSIHFKKLSGTGKIVYFLKFTLYVLFYTSKNICQGLREWAGSTLREREATAPH